MRKPRLFIASSVENVAIAEAINVNLDHDLEVTIWKNGTFKLSSTTIDDLVEKSSTVDFALFIFAADDIATIRNSKQHVVRDNVVFEMGLFVGAIGKERSFILKPRDEVIHLPTDLLGVTPADYDSKRSDEDLVSATNRACALIKSEVKRIGIINHASLSETKRIIANPVEYKLTAADFHFLAACLGSHTNEPGGMQFYQISNSLRTYNDSLLQISSIKLERMGMLEKTIITSEEYENDYFSYKITEYGIDTLLKNEKKIQPSSSNNKLFSSSVDFDDDIPF
ncbi:hypothetical protein TW85_16990 [Marinomonas sp. S3726]|uniref:TIR domain-containing protein n=1 Tax=Marinomonas sp. S3726 TaxID=579484 RepID=UPI0005FA14DD|nr:nucleotide-binding protein [Marinomonas sp. S3726]KJZ11521.1 hypothetical protein TW85_16990 [Marinomonas sp. S3726]